MDENRSLATEIADRQESLADLGARVRRDLSFLNYPPKNWVKAPRPGGEDETFDVAIIGAGMVGLAVAFALRREGISNIVTLDAAHRILEWNPGAEKIFGYKRKEVIGRNLDDLIVNKNEMEESRAQINQSLSDALPPPFHSY